MSRDHRHLRLKGVCLPVRLLLLRSRLSSGKIPQILVRVPEATIANGQAYEVALTAVS